MSRTSDSRSAVSNDAYRNNPFWDKAKKKDKPKSDKKEKEEKSE